VSPHGRPDIGLLAAAIARVRREAMH